MPWLCEFFLVTLCNGEGYYVNVFTKHLIHPRQIIMLSLGLCIHSKWLKMASLSHDTTISIYNAYFTIQCSAMCLFCVLSIL